jgi:hypothetical protein
LNVFVTASITSIIQKLPLLSVQRRKFLGVESTKKVALVYTIPVLVEPSERPLLNKLGGGFTSKTAHRLAYAIYIGRNAAKLGYRLQAVIANT